MNFEEIPTEEEMRLMEESALGRVAQGQYGLGEDEKGMEAALEKARAQRDVAPQGVPDAPDEPDDSWKRIGDSILGRSVASESAEKNVKNVRPSAPDTETPDAGAEESPSDRRTPVQPSGQFRPLEAGKEIEKVQSAALGGADAPVRDATETPSPKKGNRVPKTEQDIDAELADMQRKSAELRSAALRKRGVDRFSRAFLSPGAQQRAMQADENDYAAQLSEADQLEKQYRARQDLRKRSIEEVRAMRAYDPASNESAVARSVIKQFAPDLYSKIASDVTPERFDRMSRKDLEQFAGNIDDLIRASAKQKKEHEDVLATLHTMAQVDPERFKVAMGGADPDVVVRNPKAAAVVLERMKNIREKEEKLEEAVATEGRKHKREDELGQKKGQFMYSGQKFHLREGAAPPSDGERATLQKNLTAVEVIRDDIEDMRTLLARKDAMVPGSETQRQLETLADLIASNISIAQQQGAMSDQEAKRASRILGIPETGSLDAGMIRNWIANWVTDSNYALGKLAAVNRHFDRVATRNLGAANLVPEFKEDAGTPEPKGDQPDAGTPAPPAALPPRKPLQPKQKTKRSNPFVE